jgi:hypothetical protein
MHLEGRLFYISAQDGKMFTVNLSKTSLVNSIYWNQSGFAVVPANVVSSQSRGRLFYISAQDGKVVTVNLSKTFLVCGLFFSSLPRKVGLF